MTRLLIALCFFSSLGATTTYSFIGVGNPIGGEKQGFAQSGSFATNAKKEWKDIEFYISGGWRTGVDLSHRYIGNQFDVQQNYSGETWWLVEMYAKKKFSHTTVKAGRLLMGLDFAYNPLFNYFVNDAINNFIDIFPEDFDFHSFPYATWGAYADTKVCPNLLAKFAIYNANSEVTNNAYNGFNFQFKNTEGLALMTEWTLESGCHGHYTVGGIYYTGRFECSKRGNYSVYAIVDQMIKEGVTPFAAFAITPEDRNLFSIFCSSGLILNGPIASRPQDVAAFAMAYGDFSPGQGRDFEMVLEANYSIYLNKHCVFEPDIQYIIHPNGKNSIPNALVLGFQILIEL